MPRTRPTPPGAYLVDEYTNSFTGMTWRRYSDGRDTVSVCMTPFLGRRKSPRQCLSEARRRLAGERSERNRWRPRLARR